MGSRLAWLVLIAMGVATPASAQSSGPTTAELTGIIRDSTLGVLPGVTVTATNVATNLTRSATTGDDGRFVVRALPPGRYSVRAELPGFTTEERPALDLTLGASADVEITLLLAARTESVTVGPDSPVIDLGRTALSHVIDRRQIEELPINGRDFIAFSRLTPTVAADRTPQQGASASSGLSFAGQRARSNNLTVDGLDNNDPQVGSVRATFSQDAVQEFQVLAHSYAAEFGRASGGVVNIVTRSGGNVFSGSGFVYGRDDALNAKEYFERFDASGAAIDRDKGPYRRRQFGGVLGGPIRPDRAFFFGSVERLETDASNFVTIDDQSIVSVFGQSRGTLLDLLQAAGFDDAAGHVGFDVRSTQAFLKVDVQATSGQSMTLRYNTAKMRDDNIEPFGGIVARSRGGALDSRDHAVGGSHLWTKGLWVNEVRSQVAWRDQSVFSLDPRCAGLCDQEDEGGPTVEIAGAAQAGRQRFTPQLRTNRRWQVTDTVSVSTGGHLIKGGVDLNTLAYTRNTLPTHVGGRFIFLPLPAIPGVLPAAITATQAFALGLPAAYVQGYGQSDAVYGTTDVALFLQDDWRVRPSLTLKAGLRYQRQFWPDFTFTAPVLGDYRFPSDGNDVAPRVGLAWHPAGDRRTSLHASYGLFHDHQLTSIVGIARIVDGTADGLRTRVLRFPDAIAAWNAPGRRLPEPAIGYPSLAVAVDPDLRSPYAHHASVGFTRQIGADVRVSTTLLHARGHNQLGTIDYNPTAPALGPGRRPFDVDGIAGTSATVLQYTAFAETWYRGIVIEAEQRFSGRMQWLLSYTLSTAEDTASDFQSAFVPQSQGLGRNPADPAGLPVGFTPAIERGPALHDQRHRFVASGLILAPGDVRVAAIINAASGAPFNILAGSDLNGDGDGGNFPTDRARRDPANPSSSVGRNSGRLPAEATVDLRASRRFALRGRGGLDVLVEVFNLLNRANIVEVNGVFGADAYPEAPLPTFAQFTRAAAPRQIQIGARIGF